MGFEDTVPRPGEIPGISPHCCFVLGIIVRERHVILMFYFMFVEGFFLFLASVQGVLRTQPPSLPLHQGVPSLQRSQRAFSCWGCKMVLASIRVSSSSPTHAPKLLVQNPCPKAASQLTAWLMPTPTGHTLEQG